MPPRLRLNFSSAATCSLARTAATRRYASGVAAASATQGSESPIPTSIPTHSFPPTQPPSHRRPEFRKSQLERQYTSLIRTSPLMIFFQHNNVKATEWTAIRRELSRALAKVDEEIAAQGRSEPPIAHNIRLMNVQGGIFEAAVRVVDYFDPSKAKAKTDLTHDLSEIAYAESRRKKGKHELTPLLLGPISVLAFPSVSPEHLKAAFQILSPMAPVFPPPKRRDNPAWHDITVQGGLQRIRLLAARVEGKIFDETETRWVGSIEGGMSGLRAQLIMMLNSAGIQITSTLEGASKALYLTMESRRSVLEEEAGGKKEEGKEKSKEA